MIAKRKQEQQQRVAQEQQQLQPVGNGASSSSSSRAAAVHYWQLRVMHWALLACWRYRSGHAVGKLQYRLVDRKSVV